MWICKLLLAFAVHSFRTGFKFVPPKMTPAKFVSYVISWYFHHFPFSWFVCWLEYYAKEYGISVESQSEWYTSKADFMSGDKMPSKNEGYSGKRTEHSLYLCQLIYLVVIP